MIYLNGQKISPSDALKLFNNRSFKYGDGLFESVRVYRGNLLFWKDHQTRLLKGMETLKFQFAPKEFSDDLHRMVFQVMEDLQLNGHARLRVHVFRGGTGTYRPSTYSPEVVIEAAALKTDYYREPPTLRITDFRDIELADSPFNGLKTANSLTYVMASIYAKENQFDDALIFKGPYVAETSTANLFYFHQKKLYTPPLSTACLDGIMRKQIIKLAKEVKIDVGERLFRYKELLQADEIFLTNTIRGIMPVSFVNDHPFPEPNGGMTAFMARCLQQLVR